MREIAFDTETTGIKPHEGHRIIEIGAVEMINKYRTGKTFHVYINPECPVSEGAFRVHGLSNEFLADKPLFKDVITDFLEFVGDDILVAHNAPFDMGFLNYQLLKLKMRPLGESQTIDTLQIARKKYPGAKNSLDALCQRFDIDLSARKFHGALLDAELLADVYAELMGVGSTQRNILFGADDAKKNAAKKAAAVADKEKLAAREFPVSEAELKKHQEFCKEKVDESLWG